MVTLLSFVAFSSCHKTVKTNGLDFEKVYNDDYNEAVKEYPNSHVVLFAVGGCLNYSFEEIMNDSINLDSVYFENIITVIQVDSNVLEILHDGNTVVKNMFESYSWDDTYPLKVTDGTITAMEAFRLYMAQVDSVVMPGNMVVLRCPFEMNDSINPYYLFGYDERYVIMNKDGKLNM